jgi:hypothetical protein
MVHQIHFPDCERDFRHFCGHTSDLVPANDIENVRDRVHDVDALRIMHAIGPDPDNDCDFRQIPE